MKCFFSDSVSNILPVSLQYSENSLPLSQCRNQEMSENDTANIVGNKIDSMTILLQSSYHRLIKFTKILLGAKSRKLSQQQTISAWFTLHQQQVQSLQPDCSVCYQYIE